MAFMPQTGLTASDPHSLIEKCTFEDGKWAPWELYLAPHANAKAEVINGKLVITINHPGYETHNIQLRHKGIPFIGNHYYDYSFKITASESINIEAQLGETDIPYSVYHTVPLNFTYANETKTVSNRYLYRKGDYLQGAYMFHLSDPKKIETAKTNRSNLKPYKVTIDYVYLTDAQYTAPQQSSVGNIRLNGHGYYTDSKKVAFFVSDRKLPSQRWELRESRTLLASGMTRVIDQPDPYSGDYFQVIDFTNYNTPKIGTIWLQVGTQESTYFSISPKLYRSLMYDALSFFYQQRSMIPIEERYVQHPTLARDAGHIGNINDSERLQGEWVYALGKRPSNPVEFRPHGSEIARAFLFNPQDYSDPVVDRFLLKKGWYDAGDHGKYVVNGALALWIMQNQYERMRRNNSPLLNYFNDGRMKIPENANGKPDILDEARWEMDMLLSMQISGPGVPNAPTDPKAYMVYHKVHDDKWQELPKKPADAEWYSKDDPGKFQRVFYPPTTAATLNMAAVAAQSYRVWSGIDDAYASKCLSAAEKAWDAVYKNNKHILIATKRIMLPDPYNPTQKVIRDDLGGGFYQDEKVHDGSFDLYDEFYWAACELLIATGKSKYRDYLNTYCSNYLGKASDFDWRDTATLGTISLALHNISLNGSSPRYNIRNFAEQIHNEFTKQQYPVPITNFYWGSNSVVLNRAMILAYAYDFYRDPKYLEGIEKCMDYLMGNNAMGHTFITGYGSHSDKPLHIHHRFWAKQLNQDYPSAPPGVIVGGPNPESNDWDPIMRGCNFPTKLEGGKVVARYPLKAYVNHILSYASSEIAINWNAPLAWVAAYLEEKKGDRTPPSAPSIWFTARTNKSITLAWNTTYDNTGVKEYLIYRNGQYYSGTTKTNRAISGLAPNTTYRFTVVAVDYADNVSGHSNTLYVTTLP